MDYAERKVLPNTELGERLMAHIVRCIGTAEDSRITDGRYSKPVMDCYWLISQYQPEVVMTWMGLGHCIDYELEISRIGGPTPVFNDWLGRHDGKN